MVVPTLWGMRTGPGVGCKVGKVTGVGSGAGMRVSQSSE